MFKPALKRSLAGPFSGESLGGAWRFTQRTPGGCEVYLRGIEPAAAELLRDARVTRLQIEWRARGVVVVITEAGGARTLETQTALIHEPLPRLYESLPLAGFDRKAQRFWRRIFLLMRLPGGRVLLKFITRRRNGRGHGATAQ